MKRFTLGLFALAGVMIISASASAQVSIRAPFTRVDIGPGPAGGVRVQAPLVDVDIPPAYPFFQVQQQPRIQQPRIQQQPPIVSRPVQPIPVYPQQPNVPFDPQQLQTQPQQPQVQPLPGNFSPAPNSQLPPPKLYGPPSQQPPQPPTVIVPSTSMAVARIPITHYEFAKAFVPIPGRYEIDFIHPGICKKVVHVCFTLPPGQPCVRTHKRSLEFDYGSCRVEVRFTLFGNVRVDYD